MRIKNWNLGSVVTQVLCLLGTAFAFATLLSSCGPDEDDLPELSHGSSSLEVKDHFMLSGDLSLERLVLQKGARITTLGHDVHIAVNELVSDGAVIETFPEPNAASKGADGRNGGAITITAERASGKLVISAAGENGGAGLNGKNGADGLPGAAGTPGGWDVNSIFHPFDDLTFQLLAMEMILFSKPASDPDWNMMIGGRPVFICSPRPGNGGAGGNGGFGGDATNGGNGGDSARVTVKISEDSDFDVEVHAPPGKGGVGGIGGQGGKGGPGGPPGAIDRGHRCSAANPGPRGVDAPPGRNGANGVDGTLHKPCIQIGNRLLNCPQG